jgi:hypothetical protein
MATKTLDPYDLSADAFGRVVRRAVRGASSPEDAETRIKSRFSPNPLVWVQERGKNHFGVLVQQHPGTENVSIICKR